MRIAILGSNGQLGRDLQTTLAGHQVFPFTREHFDVTDPAAARTHLSNVQPDVVINTTAYHRVDDCETHAELAYGVNAVAVLSLARIANDLDAVLMHFSTDYVFDGKSQAPYTENSEPFPLSVYANSKLSGEYLVRTEARKHFVIRTCGLYGRGGSRGRGGNFVETMLSKARSGAAIQVVGDQILTPTSTADLARQVSAMIGTQHFGLYHMTNDGACSWYEFAAAVFDIAGVSANLSPTTLDFYKAPARRPPYSVLENARLKALGLNRMLHWRDALSEYLREKASGGT